MVFDITWFLVIQLHQIGRLSKIIFEHFFDTIIKKMWLTNVASFWRLESFQ